MSGASEAKEVYEKRTFTITFKDLHSAVRAGGQHLSGFWSLRIAEHVWKLGFTALSAGTGDGQAVYEECARMADEKAQTLRKAAQSLNEKERRDRRDDDDLCRMADDLIRQAERCDEIAAAIRSAAKAAAPSPSRQEPTSDEIRNALRKCHWFSAFTTHPEVGTTERSAFLTEMTDAVLALLDRAGKG